MIEGCVEEALIPIGALNLETAQQLFPAFAHLLQLGIEVAVRDIPLGLLRAHIRDAHLYIHNGIRHPQVFPAPRRGGVRGGVHLLVAHQTEIDGIGIAIVPAPTDAGIASHLMIADHLDFTTHKLLSLSPVGNGIFSQIMTGINEQRPLCRIVDAIEGTALRGRDLRTDLILIRGRIIAEAHLLADSALRLNAWLYQNITVLLSAACPTDMRL